MARYIDADLLIKNIANITDFRTLSKDIGEAINNTPTARVIEVPTSLKENIFTVGRLHFEENLSIEEIADRTYYSPRTIARYLSKFKEATGLKKVKFGKIRKNNAESRRDT